MTKEFAIKVLTELRGYGDKFANIGFDRKEALDMAIKALEQQPCEDCISRQRVLNDLENVIKGSEHPRQVFVFVDECVDYIMSVPSVTPKASEQQPSREWKEIYAESEGSNSWIEFKCPHCGYSFGMESGEYDWHYGDEIPWKYCPICGGSAEHKPYKTESEE